MRKDTFTAVKLFDTEIPQVEEVKCLDTHLDGRHGGNKSSRNGRNAQRCTGFIQKPILF